MSIQYETCRDEMPSLAPFRGATHFCYMHVGNEPVWVWSYKTNMFQEVNNQLIIKIQCINRFHVGFMWTERQILLVWDSIRQKWSCSFKKDPDGRHSISTSQQKKIPLTAKNIKTIPVSSWDQYQITIKLPDEHAS